MRIVADQNIPLAQELFSEFGEVISLPGREITSQDIKQVDILLVRSVTKVGKHLLEGNSTIKFVGSCTIGIDHIDTDYLSEVGIAWANAPGCNANAVVQYVLSAMALATPDWLTKTIGIIGCGNVGGRLYQCLSALGVNCIAYDPLVNDADKKNTINFIELDTLLSQADIISCHVPLTTMGDYPSYHMLGAQELETIKDNTLLINSGRGAVIDNSALSQELDRRSKNGGHLSVVLDVWENEPIVNHKLLNKITVGSPHIAGYTIEGREQGTFMIYQALCRFLKQEPSANAHELLTNDTTSLNISSFVHSEKVGGSIKDGEIFNQLLLSCYDIVRDHKALCKVDNFDGLRKNYPARREYKHFLLPKTLTDKVIDSECSGQAINWFESIRAPLS